MNIIHRCWVWLWRINRCLGFGIQSPRDYDFVRGVVNERWPYYAYQNIKTDSWWQRKMGRLCLRLANWRRPVMMEHDDYEAWWKAGCKDICWVERGTLEHVELARRDIGDDWDSIARKCDSRSVVVVEHLWRDWQQWHRIEQDSRVGTTFDLYYCGIVLFDKERFAHHYKVNF